MKLNTQRVGSRVEAVLRGSSLRGEPDLWITAYDDPDEAIADAEKFLANAREAKAKAEGDGEYDHRRPTMKTIAECEAAVGKRASLVLTGTIVDADQSATGPFVRFRVDERWGFGGYQLALDLDPLEIE